MIINTTTTTTTNNNNNINHNNDNNDNNSNNVRIIISIVLTILMTGQAAPPPACDPAADAGGEDAGLAARPEEAREKPGRFLLFMLCCVISWYVYRGPPRPEVHEDRGDPGLGRHALPHGLGRRAARLASQELRYDIHRSIV